MRADVLRLRQLTWGIEMTDEVVEKPINAAPTKTFFVEMLTKDISLEQALLDLVDNSVDAARAVRSGKDSSLDLLEVVIEFDKTKFRIWDNCGGFSKATARDYAFRFGRPPGAPLAPHSIGQFGVGMKRALFKFGHHFIVRSATATEAWAVDVNVRTWEEEPEWQFPWGKFEADEFVSAERAGTEILSKELRPEVAWKFSSPHFRNAIVGLIKSKHRQFISAGLRVSVNGQSIDATSLYLLTSGTTFKPGNDEFDINDEEKAPVRVRITVGIGQSQPKEAGWYVVCNGRVVLEADRRGITGWGVIEDATEGLTIPSFHNQFARFRGIVTFDSEDSSRVPWNTTKTDVDQDSAVWQEAFGRMVEMMRPVITFLNDLDKDIDEFTKEDSPLNDLIAKSTPVKAESFTSKSSFTAPARGTLKKSVRTVKVQYSKPVEQVQFLMDELSVSSAKAVGEKAFELTYQRMGGK
jgi:hypothetical protein